MYAIVYLVLIFGGSSTSSVVTPVGDMKSCIEAGNKAVADKNDDRTKFLCVEGVMK